MLKQKITLFTCLLISLTTITFSQSGWVPYYTGVQASYISVYFVNAQTGFCAGSYGTIVKTTNGGINWNSLSSGTSKHLYSIFFIDENTGFTAGEYSTFLKTVNGGSNWTLINTGFSIHIFYDIYFFSNSTGYLCCGDDYHSVKIIKTTNGGINWSASYSTNHGVFSIYFVNPNLGYGAHLQGILKTTNGGIIWELYNIPQFGGCSVKFFDPNTGYCVGYHGGFPNGFARMFKTTNGGSNWFEQFISSPAGYPTDLFLTYRDTAYFVTQGTIFKTLNGGINWNVQYSYPTTPQCIYFANAFTGYAGCINNGMVLKTTNGGGPFLGVNSTTNIISNNFSLSQNYPNPFNPVTKIKFDIPPSKGIRGMMVRLIIYDALGKEIAILVNDQLSPGSYEVEFNGSNYPSGVYFYRFVAGDFIQTKKMILLK